MEADFWHGRWRDNNIAFHKPVTNHYLAKYVDRLGLVPGGEVLVPLCGKSVDMAWLRRFDCRVLGVELSDIAVRDFFAEQDIVAERRTEGAFDVLEGGGIRLLCGDIFALDEANVANVTAIYDRAALVALPTEMRARYVEHLDAILPRSAPTLLLTFEYPAHEIDGPPFSVAEADVRALYAGRREVTLLESADRLAEESKLAERGLSRLREHAFLLTAP